jgi:small subunit ribosomal protein S4
MSKYTGPRNRIARRLGVNIFSSPKDPLVKRPNPPGMHAAKRKKKSDYGVQLTEMQKLKAVYGMISQKQLVITFHKALKKKGDTAQHLVESLECRLDNFVFRMRLAISIFAAQQLVSHGHLLVNGKRCDIRSYVVQKDDVVTLSEKSRKGKIMELVQAANAGCLHETPDYIEMEADKFGGKRVGSPHIDSISHPCPIDVRLVAQTLSNIA